MKAQCTCQRKLQYLRMQWAITYKISIIYRTRLIKYFFPVEWPAREFNHSSSSSAKVKNKWSYTSTPSICLHGVDRKTLHFYLTVNALETYYKN